MGHGKRHQYGFWRPLIAEVESLRPNRLLVLQVARADLVTVQSRIRELNSEDVMYANNYCDGKLFVVRMR